MGLWNQVGIPRPRIQAASWALGLQHRDARGVGLPKSRAEASSAPASAQEPSPGGQGPRPLEALRTPPLKCNVYQSELAVTALETGSWQPKPTNRKQRKHLRNVNHRGRSSAWQSQGQHEDTTVEAGTASGKFSGSKEQKFHGNRGIELPYGLERIAATAIRVWSLAFIGWNAFGFDCSRSLTPSLSPSRKASRYKQAADHQTLRQTVKELEATVERLMVLIEQGH
uniref:Uncharacterized protein n=1 Tax=Sphaerodactylus townsendi TaxID=933632 RepID=A0ACB8FXS6_9SAUR